MSQSSHLFLDLPLLLERLHRRYLDVVRLELTRIHARDINPVQVMMLVMISQNHEISVRELIERGYYIGSNASYNLKNLAEGGYIERLTDEHDRRAARVHVTEKGTKVIEHLKQMDARMTEALCPDSGRKEDFMLTMACLRRFEQECSTLVQNPID